MNFNATIIGQSIAFVIFVILCMKYIWPPIVNIIDNRQKEIANGIFNAEKAKKILKLSEKEAAYKLKQAHEQALIIINKAKIQHDKIIESVKLEADKERKKILNLAQLEIEATSQRLREDLRKKVSAIAMAAAEKIIENSINDLDQQNKILEKIIAEL
ncbi:MAG: F0F1 ATP synthase subunit B [Candidatus Dasytiphilus stammeri]